MIYYEYDKFGEDDSVVIEEYRDLHYPYLHFHRNYELICLYEGKLDILLDGENFVLNGGQFLLVCSNQLHSITSLGGAHARVCIFSPKTVNEFYQNTLNLLPEKTIVEFSRSTADFIRTNLRHGANKYLIKACLYAACAEIRRQTDFISKSNIRDFVLIHRLITYISQNYRSNISLKTMADALGYNYQYLSNYLHRYTLDFSMLLNQYRLDYAKHLLKNSDFSITDTAFECGYNNVRTFNRNFFKTFGLTPREYKANSAK